MLTFDPRIHSSSGKYRIYHHHYRRQHTIAQYHCFVQYYYRQWRNEGAPAASMRRVYQQKKKSH